MTGGSQFRIGNQRGRDVEAKCKECAGLRNQIKGTKRIRRAKKLHQRTREAARSRGAFTCRTGERDVRQNDCMGSREKKYAAAASEKCKDR